MASGRETLIEFIDKYKEFECLWKVNDKFYKNKHKRLSAMEELLKIIRKTDTNANMDSVTKKINTLRISFNKEHNKVKASYRSGAGTDDVHVPKLWYYDLLSFLADRDTDARKPSDITAVLNETTAENENIEDFTQMEPPSPCYSQSSTSTNMSKNSQRSISQNLSQQNNENLKRKMISSATEVLTKISNRLDTPKFKQKYSAFGEHVAEKLRSMPEGMALYCQKIINDAMFYADCGSLNYSSRIVTDYQHSHFQQSQAPQIHQLVAQPPTAQLPPVQLPQTHQLLAQQPPAQIHQTHQLLVAQPPSAHQPPSPASLTQLSQTRQSLAQMPSQSCEYNISLSYNNNNENTISVIKNTDLNDDDDDAVLDKYINSLRNK